jgi:predicted heme/steroid binding protein/uncharacterized membrane protein
VKKVAEARKEISREELAAHNGTDGKPVLIAFQGRVIDVSDSPLWEGGHHMDIHQAGADLTEEIPAAPHGLEVLERYPQVGVLAPLAQEQGKSSAKSGGEKGGKGVEVPGTLAALLKRFPLLRRHPHPMVVHFPIVFMISAAVFAVLYVLTGYGPFESTSLNCLGGGLLFTPAAIATGLFTWWLNYGLKPKRPVVIKLVLSPLMLVVGVAVFIWRLLDPKILVRLEGWGLLYFVLLILMAPLVGAIGWYGATLTFPLHED